MTSSETDSFVTSTHIRVGQILAAARAGGLPGGVVAADLGLALVAHLRDAGLHRNDPWALLQRAHGVVPALPTAVVN